jgi:hypothetical protein
VINVNDRFGLQGYGQDAQLRDGADVLKRFAVEVVSSGRGTHWRPALFLKYLLGLQSGAAAFGQILALDLATARTATEVVSYEVAPPALCSPQEAHG